MATATPEQVRAGLATVTTAAQQDVQAVAAQAQTPTEVRAALFAAVPLIVAEYGDGAASLALDWYEELREAATPAKAFAPQAVFAVREEKLAAAVAWATTDLHDLEQSTPTDLDTLTARATDEAMTLLLPQVQKEVAAGFRATMVTNSDHDPAATGWRRYTRAGGCKFCRMLADKGAVYTRATVRFAAHTDCECVVGPSFDPNAPRASVLQYEASRKRRSARDRAALRDYLNQHFPDAPG